jgi:UDP-glucose 4-epimerase
LATLNPKKALDTNVGGTLSVLECCREHGMSIIFSSTSSVYGLTDVLPITENHKEDCLNPYASTKYAAELLIRNFNTLHGVPATIFRYFNVFGERAPSTGQYALVTGIFLNQKKANTPLTVVGDGTQKRDFIYVKDVVRANFLAMTLQSEVPELSTATPFNIGSSTEISVIDLAKSISNDIIFVPKRKGEALNNLCSNEKFSTKTGWMSTVSILNWVKEQL